MENVYFRTASQDTVADDLRRLGLGERMQRLMDDGTVGKLALTAAALKGSCAGPASLQTMATDCKKQNRPAIASLPEGLLTTRLLRILTPPSQNPVTGRNALERFL